MANPYKMSSLLLQILSVLLFFWTQSSSAQFKPLCMTQFALANHACSMLPSLEALPMMADDIEEHENGTNRRIGDYDDDHLDDDKSKPKQCKDDDHKQCHGKDDDKKHGKDDDHKQCHGKDDDKKHGKDDDHKKCKDDDDHKHGKEDDKKHGKDDDHKHHEDQNIPRAYKNCCRWLEMVDQECVCGALLKLPPFLVKQSHEYTMMIEKACKFNYKCLGV